jgi:quercetin dioxygenase-like cupin family protein
MYAAAAFGACCRIITIINIAGDMYKYPHTIDNGQGERLTFVRRINTPAGERLEGENVVSPGAGPPMHVHYFQEEGFTVLEGRLGYQIEGQQPRYAEPGESVVFPRGIPHRFWNAGQTELRCEAYISPPDNVEFFLAAIFEAQKRAGGKRPELFDVAWLTRRYRSEFAMLEIPLLIQKLLFPVIVGIGTVLRKYRKFANAPDPRRA